MKHCTQLPPWHPMPPMGTPRPPMPPTGPPCISWMHDVDSPRIRRHLQHERAYLRALMRTRAGGGRTMGEWQREVVGEMEESMPPPSHGPPEPCGPWLYGARVPDGQELPVLFRWPAAMHTGEVAHTAESDGGGWQGGRGKGRADRMGEQMGQQGVAGEQRAEEGGVEERGEQVLVDLNELADYYGYVRLVECKVSRCHALLALLLDLSPSESPTLFLLHLPSSPPSLHSRPLSSHVRPSKPLIHSPPFAARLLCTPIPAVATVDWAADSQHVLYTKLDANLRSHRVMRRRIHIPQEGEGEILEEGEEGEEDEEGEEEEEVLRSEEEGVVVAVCRTKDWRYLTLNLNTRSSSEVHLLDAHHPTAPPRLLQRRREGEQWFVEHHEGWLYAVSNRCMHEEGEREVEGEGEGKGEGGGRDQQGEMGVDSGEGGGGEERRVGEYRILSTLDFLPLSLTLTSTPFPPLPACALLPSSAHITRHSMAIRSLAIRVKGWDIRPSDIAISDIEVFRHCLAVHSYTHSLIPSTHQSLAMRAKGVNGWDIQASDIVISDIEVFQRCLAVHCLVHSLPHLLLLPLPLSPEGGVGREEGGVGGKGRRGEEKGRREVEVWARAVQLPERVCHVVAGANQDFHASSLRIMVSSPVVRAHCCHALSRLKSSAAAGEGVPCGARHHAIVLSCHHAIVLSCHHAILQSGLDASTWRIMMPDAVCEVHMPSGTLSVLHQEPYCRHQPHQQQHQEQPANQKHERVEKQQKQQQPQQEHSPPTPRLHPPSPPLPLPLFCVPGLICQRLWVPSPDGPPIPLTLIHHASRQRDSEGAALLEGYGAYGEVMAAEWVPHRLPLLHRGWVIALAHTRGGGELGRAWHEAGRGERKGRAVGDLRACGEYLVGEGWAGRGRVAARGSSAGGFLVAAAVNADPGLFRAIVLDVPFLDALTSMSNPALPLTALDRHEWGDPLACPSAFRALRALCPVLNVQQGVKYPAALLSAALHDSRVGPWEALKWAAKVRAESDYSEREQPVVVRVWGDRGHVAPCSGREQLEDVALEHAFLLHHVGGGEQSL
ncbi:unnamed protein product [Closterium sp. NIES-64]|nr:unnamed protein product [Closterium sp. NIES-64]